MSGQTSFLTKSGEIRFNGAVYVPKRDNARLTSQMQRVKVFMEDGQWYTLEEIAKGVGGPAPSISAQLRHLRKERFGSHLVERKYINHGLYKYRISNATS